METQTNNHSHYTTSRGYVLEFRSVGSLLPRLTAQYPMPKPPTYEVDVPGGKETHEHDETTLESEQDHAAWSAFQQARRVTAVALLEAQMRLCLLQGVEVLNPDHMDWEKQQRLIGFVIPQDPLERHLHFLETEIATTQEDVIAILAGVSRESGVSEEAISSLEASFRSAVGRPGHRDSAGRPDAATAVDGAEGLEYGEPVRANGRSHRQDEQDAVMVGRSDEG